MTDNEIIKALGCCADEGFRCDECPCQSFKYSECYELITREALDLINRQKAEIESNKAKIKISAECIARQDKEIERLNNALYDSELMVSEQEALLERMKKLIGDTDKNCRTAINIIGRYERQFKSIKAEVVKEFAERLKDKSYLNEDLAGFEDMVVDVDDIDNLVKEMVGEG